MIHGPAPPSPPARGTHQNDYGINKIRQHATKWTERTSCARSARPRREERRPRRDGWGSMFETAPKTNNVFLRTRIVAPGHDRVRGLMERMPAEEQYGRNERTSQLQSIRISLPMRKACMSALPSQILVVVLLPRRSERLRRRATRERHGYRPLHTNVRRSPPSLAHGAKRLTWPVPPRDRDCLLQRDCPGASRSRRRRTAGTRSRSRLGLSSRRGSPRGWAVESAPLA